jgi:hypothetical protein
LWIIDDEAFGGQIEEGHTFLRMETSTQCTGKIVKKMDMVVITKMAL